MINDCIGDVSIGKVAVEVVLKVGGNLLVSNEEDAANKGGEAVDGGNTIINFTYGGVACGACDIIVTIFAMLEIAVALGAPDGVTPIYPKDDGVNGGTIGHLIIYVLTAHGNGSDEVTEAFGNLDDPFPTKHGGFIPSIGLSEKVLDATCTLGGLFPCLGRGLGDDMNGACSALEVSFPSIIASLAVGEASFQPSIIYATEVE